MRKLRWSRIIGLLIVLLLVFFGGKWAFHFFWGASNSQYSQTSIPEEMRTPFNMTVEQKQEAIRQARADAIEAALKSGQSQEQAEEFGERAAKTAQESMNRPLSFNNTK
ncbi:hypothetical protein [Bartonella tamiae]|uniref:Uncharacterized protein n=1 Tax=Bartonella tamiae Th239 TaxID=1094558 RepID=J1JVT0_9HYPH|nr:hypothetical protein [Bartonella tamiae]EJF89077.1 hypothetical protein ME5_01628 [Bartonella tamiae Th239]EJF94673.1 hypothetical protein MEG_00254 [Bartonella tamiae Th307]